MTPARATAFAWRCLFVFGAVVSLGRGAVAQQAAPPSYGVIDGLIADSALAPVAGATITVLRTSTQVETGDNGRFRILQIPPGQYIVIVRRIGFRPVSAVVEVPPNETLRLSYTLERATPTLDTAFVSEKRLSPRMIDFEARRALGFGQFMDQAQIERRNTVFTTELIRTFMSVRVKPNWGGGGQMIYVAMSARLAISGKGGTGCPMQVFVDGVRITGTVNLDALPAPKDLAGIEVYSGPATVPAQFAGSGTPCGVIVIWTRDGS